jgi:ATP-dependent DNA helicase RecG
MMKESQNAEFKINWRDEYLKHICAFANTKGGSLLIGVEDDGKVKGICDSKKLLEDIPNKVINYLGIIVDVQVLDENGKEYLEVKVPQSSVPISYRGVYYVKSGSTKQELKGGELHNFILRKMGRTFDEISVDSASLNDLDDKAVRKFLHKAINSNRLSPEVLTDNLNDILSNLRLFNEDGKPKGAAVLLFGKEPLRFFSGVTFKIGRFGSSDHDLRFQDVIGTQVNCPSTFPLKN